MPIPSIKSARRPVLFAAALAAAIAAPVLVNAGSTDPLSGRLDRLETRATALSESLAALTGPETPFAPVPPADVGAPTDEPVVRVAQNQQQAQANLRISQMEEQLRVLTGQVEGLQFQMTQLQTVLERLQEDIDFRFEQLEGTSSGKTDAAAPAGGDMPSGGLPQDQAEPQFDHRLPPSDEQLPPVPGAEGEAAAGLSAPMDPDDGSSADFTVVEPGNTDEFSADLEAGSDTLRGSSPLGEGINFNLEDDDLRANLDQDALDLDYDGDVVTEGDAEAQYAAGYDAVLQGDYAFAEAQFRQFVGLFPDHPQAPEAANWLGEALLQRGDHDEAAQVLFQGFQRYEGSARAPDLLFKLGVALAGAGEVDTACRTFTEVLNRYPEAGTDFQSRVRQERTAARC